MKSWENLQVFGSLGVLSIHGDSHIPVASLLLFLSDFDPLLRGEVLTEVREDILP